MWGKKTNGDRKPVKYCVNCSMEAKIEDTDAQTDDKAKLPPCTNCGRRDFATAEDYDRRFLKSLRIAST